MNPIYIVAILIGVGIGILYTLLYITFDKSWKKIGSFLCSCGGGGGIIKICFTTFGITEGSHRAIFVSCLLGALIISFVIVLGITSFIIKDKDDINIIRLRDIILGQKAYIDDYYRNRTKEIDQKLNINDLIQREEKVSRREQACIEEEKRIEEENSKIQNLGKSKIKIILPEKKSVVLNQPFIDVLPSFVNDIAYLYSNLNRMNKEMLSRDIKSIQNKDFKSYFIEQATYIMDSLFNGGQDIRVHYRLFNKETELYELYVALTGKEKHIENALTPMPFRDTMIEKSFNCKRGVIKSINLEAHRESIHNAKWKDYLTLTFFNILSDDRPILTMGISVKNAERYKNLFYFLEYVEFDIFVNDRVEEINEIFDIPAIMYGGS